MMTADDVISSLEALGDSDIAKHSMRFFKTGKGEYGEGDRFIGIRVPVIRKQIKLYKTLPLDQVSQLLKHDIHEIRLFALLLLVARFKPKRSLEREQIYEIYLTHLGYINNWDLVDSSCHVIVGEYLADKDRTLLYQWAKHDNLWYRRIAIISTLHFIKLNDFSDTLAISTELLKDKEDLIHKATGWMLREVGNRNQETLLDYLDKHYTIMPRTMLRYAIEKLTAQQRQHFLRR
ncbi:DNA alkylation repair protein [Thalassotalea euphylliae]|uniref:DNA alkylation repair protein n=1 Tax=Thalassotalea euphylliae TaxID=1655234 RepID=UPI0036299838